MSKNNAKKNNNYYFPLFMGMGLVFGVILDQIAIGLCLGVAIGLALDNNNIATILSCKYNNKKKK